MAAFDFRPRSNTELLDASVEFIRSHFAALASVVAVMQIPTLTLTLLYPPNASDPFARFREEPVLAVLNIVVMLWLAATTSVAFVYVVDDLIHGRPASLSSALSKAFRRRPAALVMLVVTYLVLMLWAMLFFLPFIWAFARYFATIPSFAIEGLGPFGAIRRSKELAKKNNGRAIALALVPLVVFSFIVLIVQQGLLGSGAGMRVAQVVSSILSIALYPFIFVPAIFLYYDLRTRREGLDLDFGTLPTAAA